MKALKACVVILVAFIFALATLFTNALPALAVGAVTLTPNTGPVGTPVTITGAGFNAGATSYTVTYLASVIGSGAVAGGTLSATLISILPSTVGIHAVTVTTNIAGDTATANFTVTPQITLSQATGRTGDTVTVTGSGFGASLGVTLSYASTSIATTSTDINGSFSVNFQVPPGPQGVRMVSAYDAAFNNASTTYTTTPAITVNPATIASGGQVTIAGTGFGASLSVSVLIDGASTNLNATTDLNGSFTLTAASPPKPKGAHTVSVQDPSFNTAVATLTVTPALTVNPNRGAIGSQITVTGSGFTSSSGITFQIDGVAANPTATSDANGSFTKSGFQIPNLTGGQHTLSAVDTTSTTVSATFTVTSSVTVNPTTAEVGGSATITGNGFGATKAITVTIDSTRVTTNPANIILIHLTSTAGGNFTGVFTVPATSGGSHIITATDGTNSVPTNFSVTAVMTSTQAAKGPVGASVNARGNGFGANASVTVKYDANQVSTTTATAAGEVSVTFQVPPSATGPHTITISEGTRTAKGSMPFTVEPAATMNPTSGNIDSSVTVTCTGFAASTQVSLKYDGAEQGKASTDANGGIVLVFTAPVSKGGNHTVTVGDSTSTVTLTFAMDSTAPPVPAPLIPLNDTKGDAMTVFTWQSVTDPSGVTYSFQVSKDPTFTTLVIDKKGLTGTGYTLTQIEKLKPASRKQPYYWRAKATDRASNESAWSSPWTFYVGIVLPPVLIESVLGGLVIIAGVVGYWLGSRAGKKRAVPGPPSAPAAAS